jgi:hypothetical protein
MTYKLSKLLLPVALSFGVAACAGDTLSGGGSDDPADDNGVENTSDGDATGGEENTFDHPGGPDIWDLLERLQEEGPPEFSSRLHSCPKLKYSHVGKLLESRGVNIGAGDQLSAGFLYRNGDSALGAPKLDVRSRENTELTTAAAARLFDIFVQAAPEIIAAMPTLDACAVNGVGTEMFNQDGQCNPDGIACIIGVPPSTAHLELCNEMITRASSPEVGQQIAVAALAAAAHRASSPEVGQQIAVAALAAAAHTCE